VGTEEIFGRGIGGRFHFGWREEDGPPRVCQDAEARSCGETLQVSGGMIREIVVGGLGTVCGERDTKGEGNCIVWGPRDCEGEWTCMNLGNGFCDHGSHGKRFGDQLEFEDHGRRTGLAVRIAGEVVRDVGRLTNTPEGYKDREETSVVDRIVVDHTDCLHRVRMDQ